MTRLTKFFEGLRNYGPQRCLEEGTVTYTYSELLEGTTRWRLRFDELNVKPGMVVAIRADFSLDAIAALFALLSMCAVAALIPRDRAPDYYLSDACAAALLDLDAGGRYQWQPTPYSRTHPILDRLRALGDGGFVLFTSGSTGRAKAALQSTERFLFKFSKPGRQFRTLAFLLFDHIAGLDTLFYTFVSGGTLILTRRRDPEWISELLQSRRVEVLPTSPSFLRMLCPADRETRYDFSSLKIITYGSEPMDPSTLARLNLRFPTVQITQKYGTTETGSPKSVSKSSDSLWVKFKSDGVDTRVIDGVLWIRSESVILGYLNAPSPVDHDGWYCTSDLVDVDGEWVRFRGRAVDLINVGGEKVAPTEVEYSILELPFVRDVVVAGEPHSLLGQVVTAKVALATAELDPKEAVRLIWRHCRQRLAHYKAPVRVDIIAGAFTDDRNKVRRQRAQ